MIFWAQWKEQRSISCKSSEACLHNVRASRLLSLMNTECVRQTGDWYGFSTISRLTVSDPNLPRNQTNKAIGIGAA